MNVPAELNVADDVLVLRLAREIAMNIHDIGTILETHQVTPETWTKIQSNTYFVNVLKTELENWNSTLNTNERTKLKAAAVVEEWLVEANRLAYDKTQTLAGKVELMKLVRAISGMGTNNATEVGGGGSKFSITINLGADAQLKYEKNVTPKVIEGEVVQDA